MDKLIGYTLLFAGAFLLFWLLLPFAIIVVRITVVGTLALLALYYGAKLLDDSNDNN